MHPGEHAVEAGTVTSLKVTASPLSISDTLCKKVKSSMKTFPVILGSCRQDILWCHILSCANFMSTTPRMSQIWSCVSLEAGQSYPLQAFAHLSEMGHGALECVTDRFINKERCKSFLFSIRFQDCGWVGHALPCSLQWIKAFFSPAVITKRWYPCDCSAFSWHLWQSCLHSVHKHLTLACNLRLKGWLWVPVHAAAHG